MSRIELLGVNELFKIGRLFDVARVRIPLVDTSSGYIQRSPVTISAKDLCILLGEKLSSRRLSHHAFDLYRRGPDVFQIYVLAGLVLSERLLSNIDVYTAGNCIRNDERR